MLRDLAEYDTTFQASVQSVSETYLSDNIS